MGSRLFGLLVIVLGLFAADNICETLQEGRIVFFWDGYAGVIIVSLMLYGGGLMLLDTLPPWKRPKELAVPGITATQKRAYGLGSIGGAIVAVWGALAAWGAVKELREGDVTVLGFIAILAAALALLYSGCLGLSGGRRDG